MQSGLDTPTLLTLSLTAVAAIVWLVRLEGRVNTQQQMHGELKADVRYIRRRIDQALNGSAHDDEDE